MKKKLSLVILLCSCLCWSKLSLKWNGVSLFFIVKLHVLVVIYKIIPFLTKSFQHFLQWKWNVSFCFYYDWYVESILCVHVFIDCVPTNKNKYKFLSWYTIWINCITLLHCISNMITLFPILEVPIRSDMNQTISFIDWIKIMITTLAHKYEFKWKLTNDAFMFVNNCC